MASEIAQMFIDNPTGKHLVWLSGKDWPNADQHPDVTEWIEELTVDEPEFPTEPEPEDKELWYLVGKREKAKKMASEITQMFIDNPTGKHLVWLSGKDWPNADQHPDVTEWISYLQADNGPVITRCR